MAAGLLLIVAAWGLGAVRWRVLLAPAPGLRVRDTFAYITIGYLANTVLPLRLGEVARATLIGRKKRLGVARALGSIAVERVFDLLTVSALVLLLALVMEIPPVVQAGLISASGLAVAVLVALVALSLNQAKLQRFSGWLSKWIPASLVARVQALVAGFAGGAGAMRSPCRLAAVAALSAAMWMLAGLAPLAWVRAFNLATPWFAGYFVLAAVNLGSAIPSSPGYIGVYHYMAVVALSFWVPDRGPALAYAIGTHALNVLANAGLGGFFLVREGVHLNEFTTGEAVP